MKAKLAMLFCVHCDTWTNHVKDTQKERLWHCGECGLTQIVMTPKQKETVKDASA